MSELDSIKNWLKYFRHFCTQTEDSWVIVHAKDLTQLIMQSMKNLPVNHHITLKLCLVKHSPWFNNTADCIAPIDINRTPFSKTRPLSFYQLTHDKVMPAWTSDIHAAAQQEPTGGPVFILYSTQSSSYIYRYTVLISD